MQTGFSPVPPSFHLRQECVVQSLIANFGGPAINFVSRQRPGDQVFYDTYRGLMGLADPAGLTSL